MGSIPDHTAGGVEGRAFPAPLPASPRWGEVWAIHRPQGGVEGRALYKKPQPSPSSAK